MRRRRLYSFAMTDGPNGFTSRGAIDYHPESGERFLWVTLSVRNDAASARQFPFDSCALDARLRIPRGEVPGAPDLLRERDSAGQEVTTEAVDEATPSSVSTGST